MRKADLVKLVFAVVLVVVAIIFCVAAISTRISLEQAKETVEGKQVIGYLFGAPFILIIAILFAFSGMIANAISILLSALGLRSPIGWMKIVFIALIAVDFATVATAAIGTFVGL